MVNNEIIRLGGQPALRPLPSVTEQLEKTKGFPLPLRVLASPRTTAGLGAILGGLLGGPLGALKGFGVGTLASVGPALASTFPSVTKTIVDPERRITEIGKLPGLPERITKKTKKKGKKIKEEIVPLITGGVIGGALGVGIPKVIEKVKQLTPSPTDLIPSQLTTAIPTPIGASTVIPREKPVPPTATPPPSINVKVNPKNEILINNVIQSM